MEASRICILTNPSTEYILVKPTPLSGEELLKQVNFENGQRFFKTDFRIRATIEVHDKHTRVMEAISNNFVSKMIYSTDGVLIDANIAKIYEVIEQCTSDQNTQTQQASTTKGKTRFPNNLKYFMKHGDKIRHIGTCNTAWNAVFLLNRDGTISIQRDNGEIYPNLNQFTQEHYRRERSDRGVANNAFDEVQVSCHGKPWENLCDIRTRWLILSVKGQEWLKSSRAQNWLKTEKGQEWLKSEQVNVLKSRQDVKNHAIFKI